MIDNTLKTQAFTLKGRLYTFTVLQLLSTNPSLFEQQLVNVIIQLPRFFDKMAVVLDCNTLKDEEFDLNNLSICMQCIKSHNLFPIGMQSEDPRLIKFASAQGIAILHSSAKNDKSMPQEYTDIAKSINSTLFTKPVRSGQQIVNRSGDLIITASVSHGAELLASGNIHVYGVLRGRALAGISGNKQVRIFCQALQAELISIAGIYSLREEAKEQIGPCQIYLKNERINFEPLC